MGFCSLGVDFGHVELVKTELQCAADAAARYAATGLGSGIITTQNYAVASGAENKADGTPVVIDPANDVEFGNWDAPTKTFTVLTGAARSNANSVRVTARRTTARGNAIPLVFARVIGLSSCDLTASCTAISNPQTGAGFVGISDFNTGNGPAIASYRPANGVPGGANSYANAVIASNTSLHLGGAGNVQGVAKIGPSGTVTMGGGTTISGGQVTLTTNMSYAATESPTVASSGSLTLGNTQTLTLGGGTYNYTQITTGGGCTIQFTGPAVVYVTTGITTGNGPKIIAYNNDPANLNIRLIGTGTIWIGGAGKVIAQVYAPQGTFSTGNGPEIWGSVIANQLQVGGTSKLYYDEALGGGTSGASISVVR